MSLGDPFGRVSRRQRAAYQALREQLQRQGLTRHGDIERLILRLHRTTLQLVLGLLLIVITLFLLFPQWGGALTLTGVLLGAWIASSFLQTRTHLRAYREEMTSRPLPARVESTTPSPRSQSDD
ncbi:MAG: hypothetical protein KDI82_06870 [Gammaproteobacteria bacterium]|nr:hypothetical protein [Gammaproteobacteria bacterium]